MSTSKYNSNTYGYKLVEESLFVTDLKEIFGLPETENYVKFARSYQREHDIRLNEKFLTRAMQNDVWKKPLFKDRLIFCRYAMHGFHYQICSKSMERIQCYDEGDLYVRKLCGKSALNIILPITRNEWTQSKRAVRTQINK
jgi:hypothetical protein